MRCKGPLCEREVEVRDWCYKHYNAGLIDGSVSRVTDEDRFWANVLPTGFCWLWTGNVNDSGYGRFGINKQSIRAHRYSYTVLVGEIPMGIELDHLCRITLCVNPDHLDPVTGTVNKLRSFGFAGINSRKTHCTQGHEYTEQNTRVSGNNERSCRACDAARARQRRAEKRLVSA